MISPVDTGLPVVRPQNALQEYLAKIIRKELAAWVKKFPDEFYENIYKLKGWRWPGMSKNRYSVVGHYTNNLVFDRIAPGLLRELQFKSPKNEKGYRSNKLHQWLTEDVGDPMLAQHLHSIVMLQRLAIANAHDGIVFYIALTRSFPVAAIHCRCHSASRIKRLPNEAAYFSSACPSTLPVFGFTK